jgi:lipoteichoic acid synthase
LRWFAQFEVDAVKVCGGYSGVLSAGYRWSIEAGPALALLVSLFIKVVYASFLEKPVNPENSILSATAATMFLLAFPLPWMRRTGRFIFAVSANLTLTLLLSADRVRANFFGGDPTSVSEFSGAWQIPSVWASIQATLHVSDALFFADLLIAVIILPFYLGMSRRLPQVTISHRAAWSGAFLLAAFVAMVPTIITIRRDADRATRREFVQIMGFVPYHIYDVLVHTELLWKRLTVTESQLQRVRAFLEERQKALERKSELFGVAYDKNVIIVQAESLHSFPVGLMIDGQPVTPNLELFSKESLHFVNFYEQTHGGATSDSVFSSLQSLYPVEAGPVATRFPTNRYRGLPAVLSEKGYTTLAAMGSPGRYWNIGPLLTSLGIQNLYLDDFFTTGDGFGQGMADADFFKQAIPLLLKQPEPFMAFLITVSNHHPYDLPERHRKLRLPPSLQNTLVGSYLQSVQYFDEAFGEFVKGLREAGLLEKSIVVVYGDHQAWLGDPPEVLGFAGLPERNAFGTWRIRKSVPLFIRLPMGPHGARTTTGGILDIAPTVLALLGKTSTDVVWLGTDLTQGDDSLVVFRDGSFADGRHFFIVDPQVTVRPICYDARTSLEVDCVPLNGRHSEAIKRLEVSDIVVYADLARSRLVRRVE